MSKVKCPYFLSKSNGSKLYINCSTQKFIKDSIRYEFGDIVARKVCFEINCCNDFKHCKNYVTLNTNFKGEN